MKYIFKKVIVDFCTHDKLGTTFKSWQSSVFGVYSDQHYNQYQGILKLAFQSTRGHTMSLCADARVCEMEPCCRVPRSLKPIRKVYHFLNILDAENVAADFVAGMSL